MRIKSLSVFFPAYNEEGNIKSTVKKAIKVLAKYRFPWEILIIDDGSTDKTGEIADGLAKEDSRVRVIHQPNGGYGMALRAGFTNAKQEWVVYMDADRQFDFSKIDRFLALTGEYSAIWGYRKNRADPILRRIFGSIWGILFSVLFGQRLRDVNCGFKMIKKSVIGSVQPFSATRGAVINVELAVKIRRLGYEIGEVGLSHYPRQRGTSTGASWPVVVNSYLELVKLRLGM